MKTLTSLILLSFVGTIFAGTCAAHPFKGVFTFVGTQADAASQATLKYCKTLQGTATCCPTTVFDAMQTEIDKVAATLTTGVTSRDKALAASRDTTIANAQDKLKALKAKADTTITTITALAADVQDASVVRNGAVKLWAQALKDLGTDIVDNFAALKTTFGTYQKARTTCIVQLLKLQAAAFCLACDVSYDTKGVTGTTPSPVVALSDTVKTRVKTACYDYVVASDAVSSIIIGAVIAPQADALTTDLTNVIATPATKDKLKTDLTALGIAALTGVDKKPVTTPAACTSLAACDWILTNWFKNGALQTDAIVVGAGDDTTFVLSGATVEKAKDAANNAARLLEQGRMLQSTWNPTEDEAGVTVTFQDDPAGVNPAAATTPSGSELMKTGLVSLIVVMLSAFLI